MPTADRPAPRDVPADPLDVVDRVARLGMAGAAPLRFAVAESDAEREASFRLRYRAVIEQGWYQPEDLPDGLERDQHDEEAVLLLAWHDDVVAATARIVFPRQGRLLPTEEAFGLSMEPTGQVVDAGRFVVAREFSNVEHRVLAGLLGFAWLTVRARGFAMLCSAFATIAAIRLYRHMGFTIHVLAPPRFHWGESRHPIRWDMPQSAASLQRRWGSVENDPA